MSVQRQAFSRQEVMFLIGVPLAQGIANGILVDEVNGLPESERATGSELVQDFAVLGFSGILITAHPPPFGPTGLALFIVAALLFVRSQSAVSAKVAQGQPSSP